MRQHTHLPASARLSCRGTFRCGAVSLTHLQRTLCMCVKIAAMVRTLTFTYTGSLVTGVTDTAGRSVSYTYDGSGNLTSVTDVNGGVTHYGYDGNHLLTTYTRPNGGV